MNELRLHGYLKILKTDIYSGELSRLSHLHSLMTDLVCYSVGQCQSTVFVYVTAHVLCTQTIHLGEPCMDRETNRRA